MAVKSVYIYGEIWDDGVNESYVQGILNDMQESDELEVVINSPGGSVFTGLGIYNLIRAYNPTVKIVGLAASMASVIACAGKEVRIADNAMLMIHNPWTVGWAGDANYFKKLAENLEKIKSQILKAYIEKTGLPEDQLSTLMNDESWIDAEEAKKLGFADIIYKPGKDEAKALYNNAMRMFAASLRKENLSENKGDKMELKEAIEKIGSLEANLEARDKAIQSLEDKLAETANRIQSLIDEKTEISQSLETANSELTEAKAAAAKLQSESDHNEELLFCERLVAENKLKRDEVEGKVAKLLALKNHPVMLGDVSLYTLERQEMENRLPAIGPMDPPPPPADPVD
ncbi:hypothetical protein EG832_21700, partial [bacterium]|nr:hypothetical protein [bacterium]